MNPNLYYLISALLAAIPLSVGARVIVCLIKINTDPDQANIYKARMKNAILFAVIAETALSILTLIRAYLS